ncbi:MAG: N-succinylarginine dihydrolase [Pseudomonadota bacterium]
MSYKEYNFDGLIGPSHNYAGLALGNLASAKNAGSVSNPKAAVLQGLSKMRALQGMGLGQGFLPPLSRPNLSLLRALGFTGNDKAVIEAVAKAAPGLLANVYSASSMWTANAATIAPSPDTEDGKVHFTPANLATNFHRSLEPEATAAGLRHIFSDTDHFMHHAPLPGGAHFGDEGAANHGRLCEEHGSKGVHLFVYGEDGDRFPARQKQRASEAVARLHLLNEASTVYLQQAKAALDAGAFHNDVVGVANGTVLFLHEQSFEDPAVAYAEIRRAAPFTQIIEAPASEVSLADAVSSYLFNSQLVSIPDGKMALILPIESEENAAVKAFVDGVLSADNPIAAAHYFDVRESMRNGGGPACLRLRVVLSEEEAKAANQHFILDNDKIDALEHWAEKHYRDRLAVEDLADPDFAVECFAALDALTSLLEMGSFYDFQKA